LGGDSAVELQPVERRIQGAFFHLERLVREQVDGLGDGIAVQGSALQGVQDQEIEGALQQHGRIGFSHEFVSYDDLWVVWNRLP
jgi:hypothetical protein